MADGRHRLPTALERFLALYRAGDYFAGHEVLEEAWHGTGSDLYRGLIILAAAFCKRERGNAVGAARNLRKALRYLQRCPDVCLGVDVAALRRGAAERLQRLQAASIEAHGHVAGDGTWDPEGLRSLVPDLPIPVDPSRVRGDEPEWAAEEQVP